MMFHLGDVQLCCVHIKCLESEGKDMDRFYSLGVVCGTGGPTEQLEPNANETTPQAHRPPHHVCNCWVVIAPIAALYSVPRCVLTKKCIYILY